VSSVVELFETVTPFARYSPDPGNQPLTHYRIVVVTQAGSNDSGRIQEDRERTMGFGRRKDLAADPGGYQRSC
jgi:hypothetical protein